MEKRANPKAGRYLLTVTIIVSFITIIASFSTAVLYGANPDSLSGTDRNQVLQQVTNEWIKVGRKQYQRFFFKQAENSFKQALGYKDYLTAEDIETINEYLKQTRTASLERTLILQRIQKAEELARQNQLTAAKVQLEKAKASKFLTKNERAQIAENLNLLLGQLNERNRKIYKLYDKSVAFYKAGDIKQAREGFIEIAQSGLAGNSKRKSAQDYLLKIDDILIRSAQSQFMPDSFTIAKDEPVRDKPVEMTDDSAEQIEQQISVDEPPRRQTNTKMSKRQNIIRSYTRAVVNNALSKAHTYIKQNQFELAEDVVATAKQTVNQNHAEIGDGLFNLYSSALKQLAKKIAQERAKGLRSDWDNRTAWIP